MTGDAKLHEQAVQGLLSIGVAAGVSNSYNSPNSPNTPELHREVLRFIGESAGSPVAPSVLELAHAFAAASLLLLTGRARSFVSTPLFPFLVELLNENLWENSPYKERCTRSWEVDGASGVDGASYSWLTYFQCFLRTWWIRSSGAAQLPSMPTGNFGQALTENEVIMLQVVAYLSPFVRSMRTTLLRGLVVQLLLQGNLNTAMAISRKPGSIVGIVAE